MHQYFTAIAFTRRQYSVRALPFKIPSVSLFTTDILCEKEYPAYTSAYKLERKNVKDAKPKQRGLVYICFKLYSFHRLTNKGDNFRLATAHSVQQTPF